MDLQRILNPINESHVQTPSRPSQAESTASGQVVDSTALPSWRNTTDQSNDADTPVANAVTSTAQATDAAIHGYHETGFIMQYARLDLEQIRPFRETLTSLQPLRSRNPWNALHSNPRGCSIYYWKG